MGLTPQTRTALLASFVLLSLGACGGGAKPRAVGAAPPVLQAEGDSSGGPVFEKVPVEQNTAVIEPESATLGPYRLEIDDQLDISVYGEDELQHIEVPIRPDGMISFAFVGDVQAQGRTVEEVRTDLTEGLRRYLRSPQVTVIAKQFAQKKIYLGGEVRSPGVFYLGGREGTLLDALYKGGLVTTKADLERSYIMRGSKIIAADFKSLVKGDVSRNVRLADQDVIYVPENVNRYVYVIGEVGRADAFEIGEPIPMVQVLARAGGVEITGKAREIAVIRGGLKAPEVAIVDAKLLFAGDLRQNITIKPGDIVYIAKNALGHYYDFIDVIVRTISPVVQATIVSEAVNP